MLQPRLWSLLTPSVCHRCASKTLRTYATAAHLTQPSTTDPPPILSSTSSSEPQTGGRRKKDAQALVRSYKPRTPGIRHLRRPINDHLWKYGPHRALTIAKKGMARGGRNNHGRITVRHRGGGHARRLRDVDFHRKTGGPQTVERIEYDPGRSAHIALLSNVAGHKSYIVAAEGMRAGDTVQSYMSGIPDDLLASMGGQIDPGMLAAKTAFRGNCLPIHLIPIGTQVYNIGFMPKGKAIYCRSAGTYGVVVSREQEDGKGYVTVRLQSGEVRKAHAGAPATIGVASNSAWHFRQLGKAGRSRWLGRRPSVRGLAMNAVDHPHGGGRGKSKGNRIPTSPWGIPAKGGYKTRKKRNINKYVVTARHRNQGKRRVKS